MPEVDLTSAEQARIDELFGLVQNGTYYELLGVPVEADAKAVQQAYYELSRAWHPDRYFRRELGPYRERLETVFASLTRAYKTLTSEAERTRYHRDLEEAGVRLGRPRRPTPRAEAAAPRPAPAPPPVAPAARPPAATPAPPPAPAVHEVALPRGRPAPDATTSAPPPSTSGSGRPQSSLPPRLAGQPASQLRANPLVNAVREQVRERLDRAKRYFQTGKEDLEAGRYVKAVGALKLALDLDPKNEVYQKLHEEAKAKARVQQAEHYMNQARVASENMQEPVAIEALKRALEYEPADPTPYFRVGRWMLEKENNPRAALQLLRKAVEKKPDSAEYRLALGDLYVTLNMHLNARREYQAVLDRDKKNEKAKAGLARTKA